MFATNRSSRVLVFEDFTIAPLELNIMNRSRKNRTGFSLLELLAVVTILGIIAVIVIPRITASSTTAKLNACLQNKAEINDAVERYYFDNGSLPTGTSVLTTYLPDGVPTCPISGNAYALDATTKRVTGHSSTSSAAAAH
jgi:prepilin-type N-terminal cleavage/methylation domain-containing protein